MDNDKKRWKLLTLNGEPKKLRCNIDLPQGTRGTTLLETNNIISKGYVSLFYFILFIFL